MPITEAMIKEMQHNNEVVIRLRNEILATKHLLSEGDPFTMTRKDYLSNLEYLLQEKTLTQESQP